MSAMQGIVYVLALLLLMCADAFVTKPFSNSHRNTRRLRYAMPSSRRMKTTQPIMAAFDPEAFANAFAAGTVGKIYTD
jgi:hypothetical protein